MSARYSFMVLLCRVLRHPAQRIQYADGGAWTRCPCRFIEVSDRAFGQRALSEPPISKKGE